MVRKLKSSTSSNNQADIIKKAKQMQEAMLSVQDGLKDKFVEVSVAGGQVTIKMNGQKELVDLKLGRDIINEASTEKDSTELSKLILSAVNEALVKAEEMAEKELEAVTGGVKIPGLF